MSDRQEAIGVVGAGLMGTEIALVFSLAGYNVVLADRNDQLLVGALDRVQEILRKGVARGAYARDVRAPIETTVDYQRMHDRDFVFEAVFEREEIKADVFGNLAKFCGPDCIIATNTSTIPISVLSAYVPSERRRRFVGTHFFSPVSRMELVEIVPGFETAPEVVEAAKRLCRAAGKTPISVKDVAGFAINRLLAALTIEAVRLVEEGVATPEDIDLGCRLGLGHPLGPFELMDKVTSSLSLQVHEILYEAYGERFLPRPLLKQRVRAGFVGGKNKPGWRA